MFETISVQQSALANQCVSYFSVTETEKLQITFPDPGKPRIRKVVTRSRSRKTGKYPSWKMGRMVQWDSGNEKTVFRTLDGDATVIAFYEQPFCVRYLDNGILRRHYPDVLVEFIDGVDVWEIKDARDQLDADIVRRTAILKPLFAQLGIRYRLVFVDKQTTKGTEAYCTSVVRFGRPSIDQVERERARRFFECRQRITWQDAETGCLGDKSKNIVARLLLEGNLSATQRATEISSSTQIVASPETQSLVTNWRC